MNPAITEFARLHKLTCVRDLKTVFNEFVFVRFGALMERLRARCDKKKDCSPSKKLEAAFAKLGEDLLRVNAALKTVNDDALPSVILPDRGFAPIFCLEVAASLYFRDSVLQESEELFYPRTKVEFECLLQRVSVAMKLELNKQEFSAEDANALHSDLDLLRECVNTVDNSATNSVLLHQFVVFFILRGKPLILRP